MYEGIFVELEGASLRGDRRGALEGHNFAMRLLTGGCSERKESIS